MRLAVSGREAEAIVVLAVNRVGSQFEMANGDREQMRPVGMPSAVAARNPGW